MEHVDNEAREGIGKLWGAFRELASDYWGPNKTNGKRSMIEDHEQRIDALETDKIKCEEEKKMQNKVGEKNVVSRGQWLTFVAVLLSCATSFAIAIIK
jgi:hypothetical protein